MNLSIAPASSSAAASIAKSLGHVGLHYRPGEGPIAARLFELLGCRLKSFGPFPNGDYYYIVALDNDAPDEPDNIVFLSAMAPQQHALEESLRAKLGVGTPNVDPALQAYVDEKLREPEFFLHFGIHFQSLEALEAAVQRLQAAVRDEPDFGARVQGLQILKARSGRDAQIDARMAASSVFAQASREAYGQCIVQVHVRTDLIATGLSFLGSVLELDYTFRGPGRERNTFNDLIMD